MFFARCFDKLSTPTETIGDAIQPASSLPRRPQPYRWAQIVSAFRTCIQILPTTCSIPSLKVTESRVNRTSRAERRRSHLRLMAIVVTRRADTASSSARLGNAHARRRTAVGFHRRISCESDADFAETRTLMEEVQFRFSASHVQPASGERRRCNPPTTFLKT